MLVILAGSLSISPRQKLIIQATIIYRNMMHMDDDLL